MPEREEILSGGNVNHVVRIGGTVRRSVQSNSYVHELLQHLEKVGYLNTPRFMGMDEKGREILTYLEGVVPGNDYPEIDGTMWSDEVLASLATLLRSYHDATVGFKPSVDSLQAYPDPSLHEVVCHNDAALYNVVFNGEHPVGLIDFDMAGPGPRIWDIVYMLYTSVPLSGFSPGGEDRVVVEYDQKVHAAERRRRIGLFVDAYGISVPGSLKGWVISRIQHMCTTLSERAAAGETAFVKMVEEGHLDHYLKEIEFLKQHFDEWWLEERI